MKIGAMNNPQGNLSEELDFIFENFDFLDLTIEPETAYPDNIDVKKLKKKIKGKKVIGHTPWNLPIASPFKTVRDAAYKEFIKCLDIFEELNVNLVNVHPSLPDDNPNPESVLQHNIEFLKKIIKKAKKKDITLMLENTKSVFNEISVLEQILNEVPGLKLHWDVGHANLGNQGEQKTKQAFEIFKDKIVHVHFSDNNGVEDQHLPIGAGNINWPFVVQILKENDYKDTITLEIHTPDVSYLLFSRDKLKFILKNLPNDEKK